MKDTMTSPRSKRNLDRYGNPALPWSRPRDALVRETPTADLTFFVATVRPDGRPHSAGVGAMWVDDVLYFTSGPGTRKSRNLAENPTCSVSVRLPGIDLTLEGIAERVTDPRPWRAWPRCTAAVAGRRRRTETRSRPRSAPRAPDRRRGISTGSRCAARSGLPPPNRTALPRGSSSYCR